MFEKDNSFLCSHWPVCVCVCVCVRGCVCIFEMDNQTVLRQRYLVQPTKKMDCPVVIHMKKLVMFPQFKVHRCVLLWRRRWDIWSLMGDFKFFLVDECLNLHAVFVSVFVYTHSVLSIFSCTLQRMIYFGFYLVRSTPVCATVHHCWLAAVCCRHASVMCICISDVHMLEVCCLCCML